MNIYLKNENKRKIVYDILNIFPIDFSFVKKDYDLKISDNFIYYGGKTYSFLSNESLKRELYKLLAQKTSYKSPWGILTGSKPSKLLKKYKKSEIRSKYLVSDEKLGLLEEVYQSQKDLDFDRNDFSLYINIPFCPSRCDYCSYPTLVGDHHDKGLYIDYLIKELESIDIPINLDSVYIGGGTPSFLGKSDLKRLLEAINQRFTYKEFTFEAGREDTLDKNKLEILRSNGVGRISLNPQTFSKNILKTLNRDIDLGHFLKTYKEAKNLGFVVNMDFIVGLVGERLETFDKNFKILSRLLPDNITFHALAIKKGSKYDENNKKGQASESLKISKKISDFTKKYAYKPYYLYRQKNIVSNLENVGYERNDTSQRYNIIINEEIGNIIGLGMNSNSKFMNNKKYRNPRNLRDYYDNFKQIIADKNKILKNLREENNGQ